MRSDIREPAPETRDATEAGPDLAHPPEETAVRLVEARARRLQLLGLVALLVAVPALMAQFTDLYRAEAARAVPEASAAELGIAAWSAWAFSSFINVVTLGAAVLLLGAAGAAAGRGLGTKLPFGELRPSFGALVSGYLALRVLVCLAASVAGASDASVLAALSAPDPSLLLLAGGCALLLRRLGSGLSGGRLVAAALVPSAVLGTALTALS